MTICITPNKICMDNCNIISCSWVFILFAVGSLNILPAPFATSVLHLAQFRFVSDTRDQEYNHVPVTLNPPLVDLVSPDEIYNSSCSQED